MFHKQILFLSQSKMANLKGKFWSCYCILILNICTMWHTRPICWSSFEKPGENLAKLNNILSFASGKYLSDKFRIFCGKITCDKLVGWSKLTRNINLSEYFRPATISTFPPHLSRVQIDGPNKMSSGSSSSSGSTSPSSPSCGPESRAKQDVIRQLMEA